MNVIIIDDFAGTVDNVARGVDWNRLQIDQVFKAYSSAEARNLIQNNHIDIMICDVEMPSENGLMLFEWAGKEYPEIECIFLTSYSKFDYAKKAINLGSFDYLLKPVRFDELEASIEKAVIKICIDRQITSDSHYWQENIAKIQEKFWYDLLNGVYGNDEQKIISVAETCGISNMSEDKYQLILIHIMQREMALEDWDEGLLKSSVARILADLFGQDEEELQLIQIASDELVAVRNRNRGETEYHLKSILEFFIQQCFRDLKCSIDLYVSGFFPFYELPEIGEKLADMIGENVADYKKVFYLDSDETGETDKLEITYLVRWETLLGQDYNEEVAEDIIEYIDTLVEQELMDSEMFTQVHSQIFGMIDRVFAEKQFDAYSLLRYENVAELYVNSLNSVEKFRELIRLLLSREFFHKEREPENKRSDDAVTRIKTYICNNLESELSRQELADRAFLNQEYLSRLFKKKTGMSLTEFIKNERMKTAKNLLHSTDMPVSIIASKVGYSNFSHFSQVFRQHTGHSPVAFRKMSDNVTDTTI